MLVADLAQALQVSDGRGQHAGGAGDGFHNDGGDGGGIVQGDDVEQGVGALFSVLWLSLGKAVFGDAVGVGHVVHIGEAVAEPHAVFYDAADGDAAESDAVISALAPDEDDFFAFSANALISEGDFEGGVDGFGAGVCEEDGVHPLGKPLGEAGGEFKDLGMPELEGGGEVQLGGLLGDGADNGFAAVSGVAAPESGGGVDELAPVGVAAIHSLGAGDHPRIVAEVAAGGKGHPEVFHFGGGGGHERAGVVGMNKNRGAGGSGKRKIIAKKKGGKKIISGGFFWR